MCGSVAGGEHSSSLHTAHTRHLNIHEHNIRAVAQVAECVILAHRLFAISGLAYDLKTRLKFKDGVQSLTHEGLVLTEQDTD